MLSQNKTTNYVVGGLVIASLALLAYTVTRPTRKKKTKNKRKSKKEKSKKIVKKFTKKPIDIHLVMETMDGFNANVAGDKKNQKIPLKYGSRLIKINDKKVENLSYQEIFQILQKTKVPITLQFRQLDDLCAQWHSAEKLKEDANADYKSGDTRAAIKKVSSAIGLHPTNKIYYSNRILMYLNNKQYDLALADCQTIRELDPKSMYIKGHYLRGLTLLKLKKYKNAASAFQTVVKLNPSFKKATDRLNECLKELEKNLSEMQKEKAQKQQELKENFEKNKAMPQPQPAAVPQEQEQEQEKEEKQEAEAVEAAQVEAVPVEAVQVEAVEAVQVKPVEVEAIQEVAEEPKQESNND